MYIVSSLYLCTDNRKEWHIEKQIDSDHVRITHFGVALGNMSVVKADVTNQSSFHYENKSVFPNKVIRDNNNIFHDSYVLMEDILQMSKKILGKQKNT